LKKILSFFLLLALAFGLSACSGSKAVPDTLIIQFVPSTTIDSTKLTQLKTLEDMLEAELVEAGFEISVNISVGTSYASVIEAMASGQVHVGFLTSQQYAFTTLEYPGKVEVLLTSVRDAYEAQLDANDNLITDTAQIIANANATGYEATTNSAVKVDSYYAMLLVRAEDYPAYQTNGIAELKGKHVGTQSVTSGSGYVYPSFLLYQNNMSFVSGTPNAANGEVKFTTITGHEASVLALLNEEVDAVFTFFDSRYKDEPYEAWQTANPTADRYALTKVVALTPPIYNDTISGLSSLSDGLREALQEAFMTIVKTTEGAEILKIYNHSDYLIAQDEDYDSERELYQFLHPEE
jgi:phosphonate transport system substrate-binding protein